MPRTGFIGRRQQLPLPPEKADVALIFVGGFTEQLLLHFRGVYEKMPPLPVCGRQLRAYYAWDSGTGNLTFDDVVLSFALLADGQLTPVSMPWVVVNALRSGYIVSAGKEGDHTRLTVKDTYAADALRVDLWLDDADIPVQAEVAWQDRRILTMEIQNFTLA